MRTDPLSINADGTARDEEATTLAHLRAEHDVVATNGALAIFRVTCNTCNLHLADHLPKQPLERFARTERKDVYGR